MKTKEAKLKVDRFRQFLTEQQKSKSTIKTYIRGVTLFFLFIEGKGIDSLSDRALLDFKEHIINSFSSASSNTYIVGFNAFLTHIKHSGMRLKCIKRQSKDYVAFPLTEGEYVRLMKTAGTLGGDYCALFKTLAGTGIRVGELKFITVEALRNGYAEVNNKGKVRILWLSDSLRQFLLDYCAEKNITSGVVFTGRDGISPLSTSAIWRKLNGLSAETGIEKRKLHPHNLRHFYASKFMRIVNDIDVLCGLLGHSDIKTTTIYTHPDGDYIRRCVNKMVA
ncbi:MAG: tyrosine-type recombinase/integrase [Oscillospiraceae bacterium]|nr:tyrosine-type recombinase/integrase [Oscillospiraceae bacterium]